MADNLIILKSRSFNFVEPSGPVQACNGIAVPVLLLLLLLQPSPPLLLLLLIVVAVTTLLLQRYNYS